MISAFGTDEKPITRAELGYEVSLAFAEFLYVRSLPCSRLKAHAVSGFPVHVADHVTRYSPRTTWTLRDLFITHRVVAWNQISAVTAHHGKEHESWRVDGGDQSGFATLRDVALSRRHYHQPLRGHWHVGLSIFHILTQLSYWPNDLH